MSDRFYNRGKKEIPPRTTTENFQLDLKEEDLATGQIELQRERANTGQTELVTTNKIYYTEKERKQQEKAHKKRNRIKAGKNKRVFSLVWFLMVLLVSFTFASFLISGSNDLFAVNRSDGIKEVVMPENVTTEQLAKILSENGVVDSEFFFNLYCSVTAKGKVEYIKPGAYKIGTSMDYEEIINALMSGDTDREYLELVFTEGMNAMDIANKLVENDFCETQKEALDAMNEELYNDYKIVTDMKNKDLLYYQLEGVLFPDTYQFYTDDSLQTIYQKMINNCQNRMEVVADAMADSSMTEQEIIILASIIQKEAANKADMYKVSAVLHNRLEWGAENGVPMLQCDSTIFYPYKTKKDLPEGMEEYESRYNTYAITGLPVGAICNPGIDAIKAALMPEEDSKALYFCHAADGTAYYADTAEQHQENLVLAGLA